MESTSSNDKPGSSSIISSAKTLQGLARPVRFEQGTKLAKFTECSGVHEHGLDLPLLLVLLRVQSRTYVFESGWPARHTSRISWEAKTIY